VFVYSSVCSMEYEKQITQSNKTNANKTPKVMYQQCKWCAKTQTKTLKINKLKKNLECNDGASITTSKTKYKKIISISSQN